MASLLETDALWLGELEQWLVQHGFAKTPLSLVKTSPKVITSTMSGGPPSSPQDGDIWIATAVDTNGTRWVFQYNASSGSSFKWEFIGGPPLRTSGDSNAVVTTKTQVGTTGYWYDGATMSIAVPRAGDYFVRGFGTLDLNGGANGQFVVAIFGGSSVFNVMAGGTVSTSSTLDSRGSEASVTGFAANQSAGIAIFPVTGGTNKLRTAAVSVQPIRIS